MALDVPSLDCYVRKRRLKYLARLTQAQFDSLHAVLQSKGNLGENMPWVDLLINDLKILRHSSNGKLSELPDPTESLVPYWTLARNYPGEWKAIVELYKTHNDDVDNSKQVVFGQNQGSHLNANSFCCGVCGKSWDSWRKLSVHKWSKHGMRSDIRQFVGDICVCPVCGTNFFTRARLVKHLLERRVRSKVRGVSCQQAFLDSNPALVPPKILETLELRDAACAKAGRRNGHTSIIAELACKRTQPSILLMPRQARKSALQKTRIKPSRKRRSRETVKPVKRDLDKPHAADKPGKRQRLYRKTREESTLYGAISDVV